MGSKMYSSVFLLKGISNLSSLHSIYDKEYKDPLHCSKQDQELFNSLPGSEKYFVFSWKEEQEIREIELPCLTQNDTVVDDSRKILIKFQCAIANIEYTKQKKKNGNEFLPKVDRLNEKEIEVVFFEKQSKVYALIITSQEVHLQRVKKLIGSNNIERVSTEYLLNTDLFSWLVYIYDEKEGRLSNSIKLANINEFVGNDSDDANVFSGSSNQTTKLIGTKAFISNGGELKKIALRISVDGEIDINFMINEKSTVVLNCKSSTKHRLLESLEKRWFLLLYLYGYLILELKVLYEAESGNFTGGERQKFYKKIGIEVIKSIMDKNEISVSDINQTLLGTVSSKAV